MHIQLEPPAEWILSRPEAASREVTDHGDVRAGRGLLPGEVPSEQQVDSKRAQVIIGGITGQSSITQDAFRGAGPLHLDGRCPCAHHGAAAVSDAGEPRY